MRVVRWLVSRLLPPGAHVHLVDVHGAVHAVCALLHPVLVMPGIGEVPDDGAVGRSQLHLVAIRVGMVHGPAAVRDCVLVGGACLGALHEDFPEVAVLDLVHRDVPAVEHEVYRLCGGSERAERHASQDEMCTQIFMCEVLVAYIEVIGLHLPAPSGTACRADTSVSGNVLYR